MRETASWTWFFIAGIVMFILLGLHMIVMHLPGVMLVFNPEGPDPVLWNNVVARSRNAFFTLTYIILLAAALYHGFYGLRTIISEFGMTREAIKAMDKVLWIVGIVLFVIGTYAAIAARALKETL